MGRDPAPRTSMDDDEEDYMSMVIEEPQQKETFTQRKRREQREAEARAKVPSKAERAAQEAARREAALSTSTLNPSNKGFQMMAKLGFKPGQSLGKQQPPPQHQQQQQQQQQQQHSTTSTQDQHQHQYNQEEIDTFKTKHHSEPLNLIIKEDRGGIGLDTEKKRKFREEASEAAKKVKQEEGDYLDRVRLERETRRLEAQFHAAQKVAERLDAEAADSSSEEPGNTTSSNNGSGSGSGSNNDSQPNPKPKIDAKVRVKPTRNINVLYRGLVRERQEKELAIQTRHMLQSSLLPSSFFPNPRLPGYDDSTLERDDREALGAAVADGDDNTTTILEQELDEEDPELDEFNALEPAERLRRIVQFLREAHCYCFWCKYRYDSKDMEGCPGVTEEDHD